GSAALEPISAGRNSVSGKPSVIVVLSAQRPLLHPAATCRVDALPDAASISMRRFHDLIHPSHRRLEKGCDILRTRFHALRFYDGMATPTHGRFRNLAAADVLRRALPRDPTLCPMDCFRRLCLCDACTSGTS